MVRYWWVAIHVESSGMTENEVYRVLKNIIKCVESLTVPMQKLKEHRLPETHRYVKKQYELRLKRKAPEGDGSKDAKWRELHKS